MTMTMQERLCDRVAVVTGAAHGIGRAYAERLGQEGAGVVVADLDHEGARKVAAELKDDGVRSVGVGVDVSDPDQVDAMIDEAVRHFGKLDIVVNNAGIMSVVPMSRALFDGISLDEWDTMMRVNLGGTWLVCKAAVPQMRANGYGKIVNISSGTVFWGAPSRIHYVSSKAAIVGFTRTLARELGDDNITVNCVAPGSTLSEEDPDDSVIEARQKAVGRRALKRVQRPEDLVGAVAFFASPDSDFITGQTLIVDGGAAMH